MPTFKNYINQSAIKIASIFDISADFLKKYQIKALVFDFDGVLNSDNTLLIDDDVATLLSNLTENYQVAVHSNAELPERKKYFSIHFPKIHWVNNPPKKPSPDALKKLSQTWNLPVSAILMVDDRLLTGGLAAFRAKSQFAWVTHPVTNYKSNLIRELFFTVVRFLEKIILHFFQIR